MRIEKLNKNHVDQIKPLFLSKKFMGERVDDADFFHKDKMAVLYHAGFSTTYLTNLTNYHAFGMFDDNENVLGLISCYQSPDEPVWYGTQVRSMQNKEVAKSLLDHMIKFNEENDRYKFYTLWSVKHAKLLRRFTFSEWANERYDYTDEYIVPAKTKCIYTTHWQVLFNRILLPHDTVVRCTFLKQKYRNQLPIGGNI